MVYLSSFSSNCAGDVQTCFETAFQFLFLTVTNLEIVTEVTHAHVHAISGSF